MNGWYQALENLVWVGQLGLAIIMPSLLCLGGCWWLNTALGVGAWVYILGFVLGIGGGAATFRSFAKKLETRAKKDKPNHPAGFNKH